MGYCVLYACCVQVPKERLLFKRGITVATNSGFPWVLLLLKYNSGLVLLYFTVMIFMQ